MGIKYRFITLHINTRIPCRLKKNKIMNMSHHSNKHMNGLLQQEAGLNHRPRPLPQTTRKNSAPFTESESFRVYLGKLPNPVMLYCYRTEHTLKREKNQTPGGNQRKMYNTPCRNTNLIKVRGSENNSCYCGARGASPMVSKKVKKR